MHKKNFNIHLPSYILIIFGLLLLTTLSSRVFAGGSCALSYQVVSDKDTIQIGDTVTRTISLKNIGKSVCNEVAYSLYYASNETFVSSTPQPRASNYYWYVGNLTPGKEYKASLVTRNDSSLVESTLITDGCASAKNTQDACVQSIVAIQGTSTIPPAVNPLPSGDVPLLPLATTTASASPIPAPTAPCMIPPVATTSTSTTPVIDPFLPGIQVPSPVPDPTSTPIVITTPITTPIVKNTQEQGIWIWNFPSQMLTPAADLQMKQLWASGFTSVYITIDDYLNIASMPDGPEKDSATKVYFNTLSLFVKKANDMGIQVDAEGGWRDWAQSANRWKGYALIDAVKQYNSAYPDAKLRGFQYDVEPYLLPSYETNKAQVLTEYVEFIDESIKRLSGSEIKFSIVIPHFYDSAQAWTPFITYGGKTAYTFSQLLTILEKKPGSSILIMAYRDTFEGTNGTKQIAEAELKEADAGNFSTKVIVSQETGNVEPSSVTYYGSTKAVLYDALSKIQAGFSSYSSYGGTAVHYMDSFLDLK